MAIALLAKSLNQRSHTFVITIEHPDTHVQIAISGQPLNRAIVCHLSVAKINSNSHWLLLENFLRLSCFFRTSMDSILLLIHPNKGSCKRKVPHPSLPSRRKKTPSDSITFLPCCLCVDILNGWVGSGSSRVNRVVGQVKLTCIFHLNFLIFIKKTTCICHLESYATNYLM